MSRIVIDTNIILLDANNILALAENGKNVIVLPETVVEEADNKKSGFGELAYQARTMGRILAQCEIESIETAADMVVTKLKHEDVLIEIVSLVNYINIDKNDSGSNDQKIIQVAKAMDEKHGDVVFMSNDVMARLRALAIGLNTTDLKLIDNTEFEFVKEMQIKDPEVFRTLHDSDIYKVDPEYKIENYSYKFTDDYTGQVKLATVHNGFIKVLGKDTEKAIRNQMCAPINAEQLLASKAILDPLVDMIIIEGQAGSGKNIVAMSNSLRLCETSKDKYQSIVYIRNPINDEDLGEDIGYLSGNEEKYAVYLGPVEDTIDFIVRQNIKAKPDDKKGDLDKRIEEYILKLKMEYKIESLITTGLRGRTFHNSIVILDEWQNASQATTQKVLTRLGKNCKVIITGSQRQIDSKYVSKYNNGLAVLMGEARDRKIDTDINMFAIELNKVVRSDMAKFAEDLFTKQ
jgi:PhoH-like ATPase